MRFSATRLQAWMDCPLAAKYRYEDRLPRRQNAKASFGTVVHHALKVYNDTASLDRARATFAKYWREPKLLGVEPDWWPRSTNYDGLRAKGFEILTDVHAANRFQQRQVMGTEIGFLVPFGEHELTGVIDLVDLQRSGTGAEVLKVTDYKTSSRQPSTAQLALDVQGTVYLWAVRQKEFWTGHPEDPNYPGIPNGQWWWDTAVQAVPHRFIWWALWSGRQLDGGPRTDEDFERLYRLCDQIAAAVAADVHVPRIGPACTFCDFTEPCAMSIPPAVEQLVDAGDPARWI